MMRWQILAVNAGGSFVFIAQISYLGKPRAMAWYTALEPAYGFELIQILGACQVEVSISGHGLRERGLGSCSSKISWSLPQCGHFNFLTVTAWSLFSVLGMGRPDIIAAKIIEPANVLTWLALDLCQIP